MAISRLSAILRPKNGAALFAMAILAMAALALPQRAMAQGTRWAWGSDASGQLGDNRPSPYYQKTPVAITATAGNLTSAIAISAGEYHSMALRNDGVVFTWGWDYYGQLGDGATAIPGETSRQVPYKITSLTGMTAVAAGGYHSVALKSDGTVRAWGYNHFGQLGNSSTTDSSTPVNVLNLANVTAIAAGGEHSLALKTDGTVWAWGNGTWGQLGNNTLTNSSTRVQVSNLTGVIAIAAGWFHSLALKSDGTVWAWGCNTNGQLGDGTTNWSKIPVQVHNLSGVVAIAAAGSDQTEGGYLGGSHSLALKSDGTVWAWGYNIYGELGNGTNSDSALPVQVSGLTGVKAIAAGGWHSMALTGTGTLKAWGYNNLGQLGNNSQTASNVPVPVSSLTGMAAIAAGGYHSLAFSYPLPSEIGTQAWSDKNTQTWPADSLAASYHLYSGTPSQLPALLTTSTDSCLRYDVTVTSATTSENPSSGSFYWYLVTGVNVAGEGSAGNATAGARIVNSTGWCQ